MAGALTGLVINAVACSSDSTNDPAKGGSSAAGSGSGGSSSNTAGKGANAAGEATGSGGTATPGTGGDPASGGAADNGGGAAAGTTSNGGSSSNTAGSSSAGTGGGGGGGTLPGNDVWSCVEAGGSCICQNNADPKFVNKCAGEYKCCFAVPFAGATRCQCQDPGTSKCSDFAHAFGDSGKVVDHCPP